MSAATLSALRELLGKAILAVADDDRERALAVLDELGRLLEQDAAERARRQPARQPAQKRQNKKRLVCPDCGFFYKWPGQLEEHRRLRHPEAA